MRSDLQAREERGEVLRSREERAFPSSGRAIPTFGQGPLAQSVELCTYEVIFNPLECKGPEFDSRKDHFLLMIFYSPSADIYFYKEFLFLLVEYEKL